MIHLRKQRLLLCILGVCCVAVMVVWYAQWQGGPTGSIKNGNMGRKRSHSKLKVPENPNKNHESRMLEKNENQDGLVQRHSDVKVDNVIHNEGFKLQGGHVSNDKQNLESLETNELPGNIHYDQKDRNTEPANKDKNRKKAVDSKILNEKANHASPEKQLKGDTNANFFTEDKKQHEEQNGKKNLQSLNGQSRIPLEGGERNSMGNSKVTIMSNLVKNKAVKSDKSKQVNPLSKMTGSSTNVNKTAGLPNSSKIKPLLADNASESKPVDVEKSSQSKPELAEILVHGGSKYPYRPVKVEETAFPDWVPKDRYILTSRSLPINKRYMPTIGNGHVATVVNSSTIHMNGLYNGELTDSHRARIPSVCAIQITKINNGGKMNTTYGLNVAEGVFYQTLQSGDVEVHQRMYAHRNISSLLVVEIEVTRDSTSTDVVLELKVNKGQQSKDLSFLHPQHEMKGVTYTTGRINTPEVPGSKDYPTVHIFYDDVPKKIIAPQGVKHIKWVFLTSISYDKDSAMESYKAGATLARQNTLYKLHVLAWQVLWMKGRIDIEGNPKLSRTAYASMYYILSSLPLESDPKWPFIGLSPGDLAHGGFEEAYYGHVFWDQETWMFPSILMFHSDLGRLILKTRIRTLAQAKENAKKVKAQGAKFPWESAWSGVETSRDNNCSQFEVHINGDISLAVRQYLYATKDVDFLNNENGTDLVRGIAEYWASRVTFDMKSDKYFIKYVMPPDEHHWNVSNSVFTNAIAKIALETAAYAANLTRQRVPRQFDDIISNLYIPFDEQKRYHPEYDGYTPDIKVKQADVILLQFPLMVEMSDDVKRQDLAIYQQATELTGPAMTWGMFAINWLHIHEREKAELMLDRMYANIQNPFQVWTENADGSGAVNFITGMGDMLQCILFGYGGLRLKEDRLDIQPILPPHSKSFNLTDIDYMGSSLDFKFEENSVKIIKTWSSARAPKLTVLVYEQGKTEKELILNTPVVIKRTRAAILYKMTKK